MFESAEIRHVVGKEQYAAEVPPLREALLEAQYALLDTPARSVVVVVAGVDGAGKGDSVNLLNEWLDPRSIRTRAMGEATDEERERPPLWRFWRALPPKGRIGIFFGSWYTAPIIGRVYGTIGDVELDQAMERVRRFEKMLTDEGTVILKLWFHLSQKDQKRRLKTLSKDKRESWRVTDRDWQHFEMYDEFHTVSSRALRHTSTDNAPWRVVAGAEPRFRHLTVGRAMLDALESAVEPHQAPEPEGAIPIGARPVDGRLVLSDVDLTKTLSKQAYGRKLGKHQRKLSLLTRDARFQNRSLIALFEGWDAAGKGGAIRRVTRALDARIYHVVPIAAPTDEENAQPYLWRFWRQVPGHRRVTILDRSWYGRVLVERVEGFAHPRDWRRAYSEINDFEEQLVEGGAVLAKFFLHIDEAEQLRRFEERERTGFKRFKITAEDWRNRSRWADYELATHEMLERTSTEIAPWTVVAANDKRNARVEVIRTLTRALENALED